MMKKKHFYAVVILLLYLSIGIQTTRAIDIPSDVSVGTWDNATRTYTLNTDITISSGENGLEIKEGDLTLDGAGHSVTSTIPTIPNPDTSGIMLSVINGVTIKNLIVTGFVFGIRLSASHSNTLMSNTIETNQFGIYLDYSHYNTLSGNTVSNHTWNGSSGIGLYSAQQNIIRGNTISYNYNGIVLVGHTYNNEVYNNNFIKGVDTLRQAYALGALDATSGNVFNLDLPIGGNYWSDWTGSGPYVIEHQSGTTNPIKDNFPWAEQNGWSNQPPIANAGPDQIVEQDSFAGASVTLDGFGSSDDGQTQPLTYTWTWAGSGSPTGVNPTVTLPLGTTTVTLTVYDGELSDADTVEITVQSAESPEEAIEHIIDVLEGMDVDDIPEDAEKKMDKAVKELNKAIDEFNNDRIDKAFDKVAKAVKHLMKAQEEGANTQDVIDELVNLVKGIAEEAIEDAIERVGADNFHVVKAQEHYDKAFDKLADGKYDAAIKEFKNAYKKAISAHGEAEAIEPIIDVLEGMVVPEDAEKEMGKAVKELNKAIDEFNNDRIDKAFDKIAKAVKHLMKAQEKGADTQGVIDELVDFVQGIAEEAIEDAIVVAGTDNPHVVKAQEHYDKAFDKLADGKSDAAIKEFKKAYREAMKALGE